MASEQGGRRLDLGSKGLGLIPVLLLWNWSCRELILLKHLSQGSPVTERSIVQPHGPAGNLTPDSIHGPHFTWLRGNSGNLANSHFLTKIVRGRKQLRGQTVDPLPRRMLKTRHARHTVVHACQPRSSGG